MHKIIDSTKAAWHRNKGKIAVVSLAVAAGTVAIALRAGKQFNAFLEEEGLSEKYYALEEE